MRRAAGLQVLFGFLLLLYAFSVSVLAQNAAPAHRILISCIPKHEAVTLTLSDLSSRELTLKGLTPVDTNDALDYVVVFDTSRSVRENTNSEFASVSAVLHSFMRGGRDRGLAIVFGEVPIAGSRFVTDPEIILNALKSPPQGRGTALYDAMFMGVSKLNELPNPRPRYMIVISDGEDTWSKATRADVIPRLVASDVHVIAVNLPGYPNGVGRGEKALRDLAQPSGGIVLHIERGTSESDLKKYSRQEWSRLESFFKYRYWLEVETKDLNARVVHPDLKTRAKCALIAPEVVAYQPTK